MVFLQHPPIVRLGLLFLCHLIGVGTLLAQPDEEMLRSTSAPVNLVLNPGFETTDKNPVNFNYIRTGVSNWTTPNRGFTDYFHAQNISPTNRAPQNKFGYESPHSGQAFAGFCVNDNKFNMQIEYLETRLWLLLETNRKYCVSLWISRADSFGGKADELGIYFSENQVDVYGKLYLTKLTPQITFTDSTALSNQVGWTRLCAVYEAKGGEEWLTLGAFRAKPGVRAHYFVDDVAVVAGESLLDCGCAGELAQPGQTYTLRNVNFAFDSADLLADSETELSKLLSFLQENPDFRIELAGHTDGMGGDAHNLDLSRRRAESVRNWLEAKGLAAGRVECKGYGASQPLNSEMTAEGRQANRRVEFRILTP